jgi:uncharacterized membrane protein YidH (DUF202 family)
MQREPSRDELLQSKKATRTAKDPRGNPKLIAGVLTLILLTLIFAFWQYQNWQHMVDRDKHLPSSALRSYRAPASVPAANPATTPSVGPLNHSDQIVAP